MNYLLGIAVGIAAAILAGIIANIILKKIEDGVEAGGRKIPLALVRAAVFIGVTLLVTSIGLPNILGALVALFAGGLLVYDSIVTVPKANWGAVLRLNRRTSIAFDEGLNFVLPLIETVEFIPYELQSTTFKLTFMAADNLQVEIDGLLQWEANVHVTDTKGRARFLQVSEEAITKGLVEKAKSVITNIIGITKALDCKNKKSAIERYLKCVFMLEAPPHDKPKKNDTLGPFVTTKLGEREVLARDPTQPRWQTDVEVPREWRLDFYHEQADEIRPKLEGERMDPDHASETEKLYGIQVADVSLSDVDYTEKARATLEAKETAKLAMEGAEVEANKALNIAMRLQRKRGGLGLPSEAAMNAGLILTGKAPGQVIIIQSPPGGAAPIPVIPIPVSPPPAAGGRKKKGER